MAAQKFARIVEVRRLNEQTKLLSLALADGAALNFAGGQYIIVNTNIPLPGGKIAKRAYSILSSDADQNHFQIAVKKIGSGPGSNYMHQSQMNLEVPFSGPWGQFIVDDSTDANPWVIATDTGITAALGLVRSSAFQAKVDRAKLFWFVESGNYFVPELFVKTGLTEKTDFKVEIVPPANHPDRLGSANKILAKAMDGKVLKSVFLSGDGALLYPFRDALTASGVNERQIKIECFFNNPFKKIGAIA